MLLLFQNDSLDGWALFSVPLPHWKVAGPGIWVCLPTTMVIAVALNAISFMQSHLIIEGEDDHHHPARAAQVF